MARPASRGDEMISSREFVQLKSRSSADRLFSATQAIADFEFDEAVVDVFPDMIERSVPDYWAMVDGVGRLTAKRAPEGTTCYDLGCSLGAVAWSVFRHNGARNRIVAVDSSAAMVSRFRENMAALEHPAPIVLRQEDIRFADLSDAGVVVLNLTLQFLEPADRQEMLNRVAENLHPKGVLFLTEKVRMPSTELNQLVREMHHGFKHRQGYSLTEIAQKAASIRNVMQVDTLATHKARLAVAGFSRVTVWHRHFNFLSIMAER